MKNTPSGGVFRNYVKVYSMTNPELAGHDPRVGEINLNIVQLITRTQEILATAPDINRGDFDSDDHPRTPEFRISNRSVKFDDNGVTIDTINNNIEVTVNSGFVAMATRADISMEEANERMESLRETAVANTDETKGGWSSIEAIRSIEISGQPAGVRIELVQKLGAGAVRTMYVKFDLQLYLPDGSTLMQAGALNTNQFELFNHPSTLYDNDGCAVYNDEKSHRLTDEQTRQKASAQLPRDDTFPLDRPIGIDQIKQMIN
jgi:hypothetical protein